MATESKSRIVVSQMVEVLSTNKPETIELAMESLVHSELTVVEKGAVLATLYDVPMHEALKLVMLPK